MGQRHQTEAWRVGVDSTVSRNRVHRGRRWERATAAECTGVGWMRDRR